MRRLCKISNDLDPAIGNIYKGIAVMPYAAGSIRIECENTLPNHFFRLSYEEANKRPALDAAGASCLESDRQLRRASEAGR